MADWHSSMQRTYEYYTVNPNTWKDVGRLNSVMSCTINRDSGVQTLGSSTIDISDTVGECYIRVYMITIQNGIEEKHPLGTFLVQGQPSKFDGRVKTTSLDGYTPLIELKENPPPLGYSILKDENIMDYAHRLIQEHARAPVVKTSSDSKLFYDFVANTNDTWLSFISDLVSNAKYTLALDEMGRILFAPVQDTSSLQPVWTYDDSNSSILYPDLSIDRDIYGIPNVVEVIYSVGNSNYYARVVNDDPNSPISTVSRGREILHRIVNPDGLGDPTGEQIDLYAKQVLRAMSSLEYSVTYTHGYCPVRIGDCVRLNHTRAGLTNVKAKVVSQSIKCDSTCAVTETAVFTNKLWG